jgi:hypothetical protein
VRYSVFSGEHHYPCGGWKDLKGSFETFEEAKKYLDEHEDSWKWAHIVDLDRGLPVLVAKRDYGQEGYDVELQDLNGQAFD